MCYRAKCFGLAAHVERTQGLPNFFGRRKIQASLLIFVQGHPFHVAKQPIPQR